MDVLNLGSTSTSGSGGSTGGPPPPGPPLMGAMMPGPPQPFSGTFFVPQQPPGTHVATQIRVCVCMKPNYRTQTYAQIYICTGKLLCF